MLHSEDTQIMIEALRALGFSVEVKGDSATVNRPTGDRLIPATKADLFVGNSGTTMRFLTAMVSLGKGSYRLDGVPRMRERPIQDLLGALGQLGVRAYSENENGCPPVVVDADGLRGGRVRIRGCTSSQFLSGLLMAAPVASGDITIELEGPLVSEPYARMTVIMANSFGAKISKAANGCYCVTANQGLGGRSTYAIEPDASAASYFMTAPAICGGGVTIDGLTADGFQLQGDVRFADALKAMGMRVAGSQSGSSGHTIQGNKIGRAHV